MKWGSILILFLIFSLFFIRNMSANESANQVWIKTPAFRIMMKSTADWARIMFDDNKIRFFSIEEYGWTIGYDEDDIIDVGSELTWYDILYNGTSTKKTGDIVAFFKQNNDFDYTEMYADIVFEVNETYDKIIIFLMVAGQGTTTFEFINKETGTVVWKEVITGIGGTQHIQKFIPTQILLRSVNVDSTTVLSITLITICMIIIFNIPKLEIKSKKL